jgi:hypothetical protein
MASANIATGLASVTRSLEKLAKKASKNLTAAQKAEAKFRLTGVEATISELKKHINKK